MTGFTVKQKREILERDGGVCLMWGSNPQCRYEADTVNHRINRGAGGSRSLNVLVNGCAICSVCNGLIESDSELAAVARERGVKVRSSHNADRDLVTLRLTPLMHPVWGLYRLSIDGHKDS